jgi:hypothetical protein
MKEPILSVALNTTCEDQDFEDNKQRRIAIQARKLSSLPWKFLPACCTARQRSREAEEEDVRLRSFKRQLTTSHPHFFRERKRERTELKKKKKKNTI